MSSAEDLRYGLSLAGVDPAALTGALRSAIAELGKNPRLAARALGRLTVDEVGVVFDAARTALGARGEPRVRPGDGDRRFQDRAWSENAFLRFILESYLVTGRAAENVLDDLELDAGTRQKAHFALGVVLDALSPSNLPWVNPTVVKEAYDTGGVSLGRGFTRFVEDLARNGGRPSQVDSSAFELGRNLAATPGRVVFRNDLLELLAYEPTTAEVHAEPILYSPPWINKYYVLDLSPGRSFIEHAVARGFTVLAISYRNPDATMSELTLDDYVRDGFLTALDRAAAVAGSDRVNVVSLCVGGTMTAISLAVLARRGEAGRVGWAALLNSFVDFSEPGDIAAFTDEEAIERIERRVEQRGFMDESEVSGPFTLMKSNDLVWRYVVSSWQMGKRPEPFDILAWNADATRLPGKMHLEYLRACYLHNLLTQPDGLVVDGTPVDVSRIETPLYLLGSRDDHIVPWRSAYRTTQLTGGDARFTLTAGGHIAGLVVPPDKARARFWTQGVHPPDPEAWLEEATEHQGSWWEDWATWASQRSGKRVSPPVLPEGDPAPGSYVRS
ncbi:MAG: alpha/beta fold hydrolase [Actinobacteria bacterium]|nr:alpha/beta fold hydrolase [Actinomycetota bacterium]